MVGLQVSPYGGISPLVSNAKMVVLRDGSDGMRHFYSSLQRLTGFLSLRGHNRVHRDFGNRYEPSLLRRSTPIAVHEGGKGKSWHVDLQYLQHFIASSFFKQVWCCALLCYDRQSVNPCIYVRWRMDARESWVHLCCFLLPRLRPSSTVRNTEYSYINPEHRRVKRLHLCFQLIKLQPFQQIL